MKWTTVHVASSRPDAEVVAARLRAEGIRVFVTSDDGGAVDPALAFSNGVQVRVPDDDAGRAVVVLGATQRRRRTR